MANMYNINDLSMQPHENPEWFTRALYSGRLVQDGVIRVMMGVKGDELLSQIDLQNDILQLDGKDCAWTPNQVLKLSEKIASVKTYKINLEQCIDELENKRTLYQLGPGANNESLPDELEAASLILIAIGIANEIETMIIGGDSTTNPNHFDGMVKTLMDSTQAAKIAGEPITTANVLGAVQEVYDAFSEDVLQAEDRGELYVFGSYATRRKIRNALAVASNQVLYPLWSLEETDKRNPRLFYSGVEFIPVKGINNNTLVGIASNNAVLLTDLMSDLENVEIGQFPKPMDNKVWIKGRLRLGFVIPFEDEAVIWSDDIATDQPAADFDDLRIVPTNLVFDVAGETKTFTIITKDTAAEVSINAAGSGFTATKGTTTAGVTTVTVVATDIAGSIPTKTGQVVVSIDGTDRSATLMLEQRNDAGNATVEE